MINFMKSRKVSFQNFSLASLNPYAKGDLQPLSFFDTTK